MSATCATCGGEGGWSEANGREVVGGILSKVIPMERLEWKHRPDHVVLGGICDACVGSLLDGNFLVREVHCRI